MKTGAREGILMRRDREQTQCGFPTWVLTFFRSRCYFFSSSGAPLEHSKRDVPFSVERASSSAEGQTCTLASRWETAVAGCDKSSKALGKGPACFLGSVTLAGCQTDKTFRAGWFGRGSGERGS